MLVHSIAFDPTNPASALAQIPAQPGVFALFAADERAEPGPVDGLDLLDAGTARRNG